MVLRDGNLLKTSVGVQVVPEEMKKTKAINPSCASSQPAPSTWCEWPDGRFCIETQTPIKSLRTKSRAGRKPKGQPPLVDPLTGLEISKRPRFHCQNELEGDKAIVNDEANDSDKVAVKRFKRSDCSFEAKLISVGCQVTYSEMMGTSKIEPMKSWTRPCPGPSARCRWLDGRICICTQTPTKVPKLTHLKHPKGIPPLVDPLTGLQITHQPLPHSESTEKKSKEEIGYSLSDTIGCGTDFKSTDGILTKLCTSIISKGVQVIRAEVMKTEKIIAATTSAVTTSPSMWCKWLDGRVSLSTQTSSRGKRKPGKPSKGRPPLINPFTGLEIESDKGVTTHAGESFINTEETMMSDDEVDVDELIMAEIMRDTDSDCSANESTQLCIVENKDVGLQVDLPKGHFEKFMMHRSPGHVIAEWSCWPDGRQCRSSQTSDNSKTRKRKQRNNHLRGADPPVLPWSVIAPNLHLSSSLGMVNSHHNFI